MSIFNALSSFLTSGVTSGVTPGVYTSLTASRIAPSINSTNGAVSAPREYQNRKHVELLKTFEIG
jgi:hypothetical protein